MSPNLFRLVGSSKYFISMGVTNTCFKGEGKMPVVMESLKM